MGFEARTERVGGIGGRLSRLRAAMTPPLMLDFYLLQRTIPVLVVLASNGRAGNHLVGQRPHPPALFCPGGSSLRFFCAGHADLTFGHMPLEPSNFLVCLPQLVRELFKFLLHALDPILPSMRVPHHGIHQ